MQFGTVIFAFHQGNACLVCSSAFHVSIHDQYNNAVHKFDMALSVFGHVKLSLSLAMRVLVVNIFMFTLFSYPNRQFFMPRVLLQEIERKVFRFLTPITWAKLGMFAAVGALYGAQLFLQDLRLSNVTSVLSTHEALVTFVVVRFLHWDDGDDDTHFFAILPSVGRLRSDFFRHTVGTTHSEILSEAGHRRPKRLSFFVSTLGWCRTLGRFAWNIGWGWSHVASYTTTLAQECASTSQMVSVDSTPQCSHCFCQTGGSASR